jgi:hypothetical protein
VYKVVCKDGYANGAAARVRRPHRLHDFTLGYGQPTKLIPAARLATQVLSQLSYRPEGTAKLQVSGWRRLSQVVVQQSKIGAQTRKGQRADHSLDSDVWDYRTAVAVTPMTRSAKSGSPASPGLSPSSKKMVQFG